MPRILRIENNQKVLRTGGQKVLRLQGSTVNNFAGANKTYNEVPSGSIDGINATFTSANAFDGSTLELFLNGHKQKVIDDYTITNSTTFVLTNSPVIGDNLLINYTPL